MIYALDLFGVAVFAISGALGAKRAHFDLFGVIVASMITSLGGGTIRDMMIGRTPVFWMQDNTYILIAVIASVLSFFTMRKREPNRKFMLAVDALGLGVFTIIGVEVGLEAGLSPLVSIITGVMTGTFGGLIRDLLFMQVPLILHREIYATASLIGAIAYILLSTFDIPRDTVIIISIICVIILRFVYLYTRWSLPLFIEDERA